MRWPFTAIVFILAVFGFFWLHFSPPGSGNKNSATIPGANAAAQVVVSSKPVTVNVDAAQCVDNPFYYLDEKRQCKVMEELLISEGDNDRTLVCYDQQLGGDARPCSGSETLSGVAGFQCLTSWMFKPWFKWEAPVIGNPHFSFKMKSGHTGKNLLYELENVCIKPWGKLMGVSAQVGQYFGKDETHNSFHRTDDFKSYLENVEVVDKLPGPIVDRTAILFPCSVTGIHNVGHTVHRIASLLELMRAVKDNFAGVDPLVIVVLAARVLDMDINPLATFLGVISKRGWASVMSSEIDPEVALPMFQRFLPFSSANAETLRAMASSSVLCFRRAVAWQNCRSKCVDEAFQFSLWGHRTAGTVRIGQQFRRAVAECIDVVPPAAVNQLTPSIAISYRTRTRRWQDWQLQFAGFKRQVHEQHGRVRCIFETQSSPPAQIFRCLLQSDVLMGPHGSGMALMLFLPPGGVVVETRPQSHSDVSGGGDLKQYIFGAQVAAAQLRHFPLTLPEGSHHSILDPNHDSFDIPGSVFALMLKQSIYGVKMSKEDALIQASALTALAKPLFEAHQLDESGEALFQLADTFGISNSTATCLLGALRHWRTSSDVNSLVEVVCRELAPRDEAALHALRQIHQRYVIAPDYRRVVVSRRGNCMRAVASTSGRLTVVASLMPLPLKEFHRIGGECFQVGGDYIIQL